MQINACLHANTTVGYHPHYYYMPVQRSHPSVKVMNKYQDHGIMGERYTLKILCNHNMWLFSANMFKNMFKLHKGCSKNGFNSQNAFKNKTVKCNSM